MRFPRLCLRALLIAVAVAGLTLGGWTTRKRSQRFSEQAGGYMTRANLRFVSIACASVLIAGCGDRQEPKVPTPQPTSVGPIPRVVAYLRSGGIALEGDPTTSGWWEVDAGPAAGPFDIEVAFKDFPPGTTAREMERDLMAHSLPYHINVAARLAMSFPHLRGRPGASLEDLKVPDAESLAVSKDLVRLFLDYPGPDGEKTNRSD